MQHPGSPGADLSPEFAAEVPRMTGLSGMSAGLRRPQPRTASEPRGETLSDDNHDHDWVVWSETDVGDWVDLLLGSPLGEAFRLNKVDGPTLLELTDDDLRVSLGITNALHRQKILGHVRVFQLRRARLAQHAARARLTTSPPRSSHPQDLQMHSNGERVVRSGASTPSCMGPPSENGGSLHYAPPSRKKAGRGAERFISSPSSLGASRPGTATEASSVSGDSRRADNESTSGFSSVNRFSRYTNPSRTATAGLSSCFGLDSPSYSVRGSWSTAPSRPLTARVGPGPCAYNVDNLETMSVKMTSPRMTIGTSTRDTSEHFVRNGTTLGGGKFLPANTSKGRVKGGVIGTSSRWASSGRLTPGPATYNPRQNFLSTFK